MADAVMDSYPGGPGRSGEWRGLREVILGGGSAGGDAAATEPTPDPLLRPETEQLRTAGFIALLLLGAALLHVLFTLTISAAGAVLKGGGSQPPDEDEQVAIAVIELPAQVETPPTLAEPEADKPEPEPEADKPEPEPEPEADKPKPRPKPAAKPEPEPEPEKRRRVVGLSLESTVEGGSGASFAVGNTRSGATETRARDPHSIDKQAPAPAAAPPPPNDAKPVSKNRRATRIPSAGVKLVKPKRKQRIEPAYPELLRARGIEDNVVVQVAIDATGRVTGVEIISASKHPELNAAARAAALKESFHPATKNGEPIEFSLSFTYRFRLNE